jgi:hypothetical protein
MMILVTVVIIGYEGFSGSQSGFSLSFPFLSLKPGPPLLARSMAAARALLALVLLRAAVVCVPAFVFNPDLFSVPVPVLRADEPPAAELDPPTAGKLLFLAAELDPPTGPPAAPEFVVL